MNYQNIAQFQSTSQTHLPRMNGATKITSMHYGYQEFELRNTQNDNRIYELSLKYNTIRKGNASYTFRNLDFRIELRQAKLHISIMDVKNIN